MLQQFYPDHEADSAYGIDYKTLYRKGYRGIIFDIDNTLVPHGAPATPQAIAFLDVYKRQVLRGYHRHCKDDSHAEGSDQ